MNATDAVNRAISSQVGEGPTADALRVLARGGSGSGSSDEFPNRYDLSVNSARVEGASSSSPSMITGTVLNNIGAFTGPGTGNKAILGFKGHSGLPLASVQSIVWEWEDVAPQESPPQPFYYPYVNLQILLSAGEYKLLAIDPSTPVNLNIGTLVSTGPNRWRFTHVPATNFVQVVGAFSAQPAAPPKPDQPVVSPPVPVAAGAGPAWPAASFRYSDLLAAFPGAVLIDAYVGDNGLPGPQVPPSIVATPTPAMLMCIGDSGARVQRNVRVASVLLNGAPA